MSLHHRQMGPAGAPVVLMVHGYPESSFMWRHLLEDVAGAGWRGVAPDLAGYGDSPPDPPATWERQMAALERFRIEQSIDSCVLVVHDWGGLIGLRWACEHPDAVRALVISCSGFFPDGKWNGMARVLREPGSGEEAIGGLDRAGLAGMLGSVSSGIGDDAVGEYWKAFADPVRRRGQLELYRSGDFEKLAAYRLADLEVPVLLLWGADDSFAPVAGAHRFARELDTSELVVIDGAGHFVFEDEPRRCSDAVLAFLARLD